MKVFITACVRIERRGRGEGGGVDLEECNRICERGEG